MTAFDNREKAYESKFVHEEEMKFIIEARRNKLMGLWAAALMGLKGEEATQYAKEIQLIELTNPGPNSLVKKITHDLEKNGVLIHLNQVIDELALKTELAKSQIFEEIKV